MVPWTCAATDVPSNVHTDEQPARSNVGLKLDSNALAELMPSYHLAPEAQRRQTSFRCAVVDAWGAPEGGRVLEIGCGQGDTTAVLANAVGPTGSVVAIDAGPPTYGSPITIGDSMRGLIEGPLGDRIDSRMPYDLLATNEFDDDAFDIVVLAHCSWYFASMDQLRETLRRALRLAPRLGLSEWDIQAADDGSLAHRLAIQIQAEIGTWLPRDQSNIRTLTTRDEAIAMLAGAGWELDSVATVDSRSLDDGKWEVAACLAAAKSLDMLPTEARAKVEAELDAMRGARSRDDACSLRSFALVASRS